jgi:hypothetical protein
MKPRSFRPNLTQLEERLTPALTVSFSAGTLTVTGTPTAGPTSAEGLFLSMPSPGVVQLQQKIGAGPTVINYGTFAANTIRLNLTSYNTNINFDLNGNSFNGNLYYSLGRGDSDLTSVNPISIYSSVLGGKVSGSVNISGGSGQEIYNIGQIGSSPALPSPVTINGNVTITAPGSVLNPPFGLATGSHLFIDPSSTVFGNVSTMGVEAVDVGAIGFTGGRVGGSLTVNASGATLGANVELYGSVGGDVNVTGNASVGGGFGDTVIVNSGAIVGGNMTANLGDGVNLFQLLGASGEPVLPGGSIGGSLSVSMGNGPDVGIIPANEIDLLGTVGKSASFSMGNSHNVLYFDPAAVVGGNFSYTGGNGVNDLDGTTSLFAGTSFQGTIGGNLLVNLGNGTNNLTFSGTVNGSTFSYTAGTGNNTLTLTNASAGGTGSNGFALTVTLAGGGNNTVAFGTTTSVGRATINFGTGVTGTKTWTPPTLITFPLTLLNFP